MNQQPLVPEIKRHNAPEALPHLDGSRFDQEKIIPLSLIRQHTKTDDVPHVTDELLSLYRDAALRAAENYMGILLREQRVINQDVSSKIDITAGHRPRPYYTVSLEYPTVDGVLYLYGGKEHTRVETIKTTPGATKVRVPVNHYFLDMTPCCGDPCHGARPTNGGMFLMYRAGLTCEADVPPCVVMGALKYIAWSIGNPGDEPLASVNLANVNPQAGRNNAAWQSGAVEEWRVCMVDAY